METKYMDFSALSEDYYRIEDAIHYLESHYRQQPELKEIAASVNLSEYHFQRLFTRWVGISPKRFLQYLSKEYAKQRLAESESVLDVAYETGLSGPGRLHDLLVACEAVTPGEYKNQGEGLQISYGFHATPFGECLLAATPRGISDLVFVGPGGRPEAIKAIQRRWSKASLVEDPSRTLPLIRRAFKFLDGNAPGPLALHLRGTNFQIKVWEALLQVPPGALVTYEDIAVRIGMPGAARAVGNAIGSNPIPVLIPCHRVIRKAGEFGGYRYGSARKKAIVAWEMARKEQG